MDNQFARIAGYPREGVESLLFGRGKRKCRVEREKFLGGSQFSRLLFFSHR
jgi:hypothetical protein